jgi:hypothetical protein
MFGLLRRRPAVAAPPERARPALEWLEARDCPDVTPLALGAPPTITLNYNFGAQHNVTLSGHVSDLQPANLNVEFSGQVSGTAKTNANGDYSVTLQAANLGEVDAQVTDDQGMTATAAAQLEDPTPQISNFKAVETEGDIWTFTGQVTAGYASGLTVNFSGTPVSMQGKSATVNAEGTFSFTIRLDGQPDDNGTVLAQVTDWWGYTSNKPGYYVYQS